jgi:hypothetical protein
MSFLKYEDKIIILLDTASLNEIKIHIFLINSKKDLSSQIESLLKFSLSKIQIVKKHFKTILWIKLMKKLN